VGAILQPGSVINDGWGVWHELGHLHQQKWEWNAVGEVTTNIYSLYVQRVFTGQSRLALEDRWPSAFTYLNYPNGTKDYNGSSGYANSLTNVFTRLLFAGSSQ
jgi:hypothetical protein